MSIRILITQAEDRVFFTVDPPHALLVEEGQEPTPAQSLAMAALAGMQNLSAAAIAAGIADPSHRGRREDDGSLRCD